MDYVTLLEEKEKRKNIMAHTVEAIRKNEKIAEIRYWKKNIFFSFSFLH
jgi:hypothetical protein